VYPAQLGVPLSLFHPVRDINGNYVAGQAASVTKALLGPDRLAAPTELAGVTLSDYATGWVRAVFTGTRLGEYTLELSNPVGTDERRDPYPILVGAGVAPSVTLLTSLDRVRARMMLRTGVDKHLIQPGEVHEFDALLNLLISEVSDEYQAWLGRTFAEQSYSVYLDGTGRASMVLPAGPLVTMTSLHLVEYQDDGAGGVTEVLTLVPRSSYVLSGLRTFPGFRGLGRVDLVGGCAEFTRGAKNYRAVFTAGFSTVPEGIVGLATEDVVYRLMTRDTGHLLSQSLGDGSISYMRPAQMFEQRETRLAPYLLEAA
jgi:hypothetical protein